MLVKDIYGCDYTALGLPGDLIASSFGKAISLAANQAHWKKFVITSLTTISVSIHQLSLYPYIYVSLKGLPHN